MHLLTSCFSGSGSLAAGAHPWRQAAGQSRDRCNQRSSLQQSSFVQRMVWTSSRYRLTYGKRQRRPERLLLRRRHPEWHPPRTNKRRNCCGGFGVTSTVERLTATSSSGIRSVGGPSVRLRDPPRVRYAYLNDATTVGVNLKRDRERPTAFGDIIYTYFAQSLCTRTRATADREWLPSRRMPGSLPPAKDRQRGLQPRQQSRQQGRQLGVRAEVSGEKELLPPPRRRGVSLYGEQTRKWSGADRNPRCQPIQ